MRVQKILIRLGDKFVMSTVERIKCDDLII